MNRLKDENPRVRRSTGAWLIRKELPVGRPKPPARPPSPGGTNTPGGATGGGMICPGTDRTGGTSAAEAVVAAREIGRRLAEGAAGARAFLLAGAGGAGAVDETALESSAQKVLRKPSALGGKSIYLTVIEGDLKGKSFDITGIGTYTIGRKECDIVLDDEKVSRKHASVVIIRESQYAVQDLASRNGTFVNGIRLTRRNVQHNDVIRVGNTTLRFTVFDGPVPVEK
jgi:FHA domain-containing protein